jgi:hypothetical protein
MTDLLDRNTRFVSFLDGSKKARLVHLLMSQRPSFYIDYYYIGLTFPFLVAPPSECLVVKSLSSKYRKSKAANHFAVFRLLARSTEIPVKSIAIILIGQNSLPVTAYRKVPVGTHPVPYSHVVQGINPCKYRAWGRGVFIRSSDPSHLKTFYLLLGTLYYYFLYKTEFKAMPTRRVTFVVPYEDSDESDSDLDDYNSNYEDAPDPEEEEELDLD